MNTFFSKSAEATAKRTKIIEYFEKLLEDSLELTNVRSTGCGFYDLQGRGVSTPIPIEVAMPIVQADTLKAKPAVSSEIGVLIQDWIEANKPSKIEARILNDFAYHAPTGGKKEKHERVRELLKDAALELTTLVPEGRELSQALTKLEETMVWCNAGIARNPEKV